MHITPESQEEFLYQDDVVASLESAISVERLGPYLKESGFKKDRALKLYIWNANLSESLHFPLQNVEVTIRNAINDCLIQIWGPHWFDDCRFLSIAGHARPDQERAIDKVKARIVSAKNPVTNGRVVAGLSFEFWVSLLTKRYDRPIWQTRLHDVFPNLPKIQKRADIRTELWRVKEIRNRVAHYEPVFERDLSFEHSLMIKAIRYRCEHLARWVNHHSRFHSALRLKP